MKRIKNKLLKFLCVVIVLIFSFTPLSLTTFAGEYQGTCGENLTWDFEAETGTLTISGSGPMIDFKYYGNQPWEEYNNKILNLVIDSGVTSVGKFAFANFYELINVTIAETVEVIDDNAFFFCENIHNVTFSEGLKHIGDSAFEGIMELSVLTIPDSVLTIGDYAFYDCECLREIKLSKNVQSIGDYAFAASSYLKTISIDKSNEFYCTEDDVLFNKNKTTLIQYPVSDKKTCYIIPDSVTSISGMAFYECENLTDVTISESVKNVGPWCFDGNEETINIHYSGTPALWAELITNSDESNDTLLEIIPHYCVKQGGKTATCQNEGYSDGWYCEECEKFVVEPQMNNEIDPDNHVFDESGNCLCGATEDTGINNNFGFPEQMKLLDIILNFIQIILNLLF